MEKFRQFFAVLTAIRSGVRYEGHRTIKEAIGDSTRNHRTPSVRQMIRLGGFTKDRRTTRELTAVYTVLRPYIIKARKDRGSSRTDAIDIAEMTNTYRELVMNKKTLRRQVGQALGKA